MKTSILTIAVNTRTRDQIQDHEQHKNHANSSRTVECTTPVADRSINRRFFLTTKIDAAWRSLSSHRQTTTYLVQVPTKYLSIIKL